jgi:glutathione-regulated potassium-efflux system ancillary protein KefC/glutathione-regulated potassium-efflux system protein KefB
MSLNLELVVERPAIVLSFVAGLMLLKAIVLYALGRYTGHSHDAAFNLALYLSQGGEFAFVLFTAAAGAHVMDAAVADLLVVVVSVSLLVTPLLVAVNERYLGSDQARSGNQPYDRIDPREHRVIIAGFGRFGQIIARTLRSKRIPFTALDVSFEQVDFVRKFGNEIYYGDASRLDLLRAARAETAEAFVLAIDDVESSLRTAEMVRKHYPQIRIYARARNRRHAYRLRELGVERIVRETFHSSLELARDVLVGLGFPAAAADDAVRRFRQHDEALLRRQQQFYRDESQLIASTKQAAAELAQLFEQDENRDKQ